MQGQRCKIFIEFSTFYKLAKTILMVFGAVDSFLKKHQFSGKTSSVATFFREVTAYSGHPRTFSCVGGFPVFILKG